MSSSWGLVLLLLILVSVLLVSTWIHIRRGHRHSGQRPSSSAVYFPSRGRARWVGETALATVTTSPVSQESVFLFLLYIFGRTKLCFFPGKVFFYFCILLDMLVARRKPTPCYRDAYPVDTLGERLAKPL